MHQNWRMIDYSSKTPAMNLAIDEAILRCTLEDHNPNTLRLWQNPPAVVIGCFQNPKFDVDTTACKRLCVNILRRISGGGAVYHDYGNLNYSLIIHKSSLKVNIDNVKDSYSIFCGGVIEGLKMLGIDAYDKGGAIMVDGKKVSGSAQYRLYDAILHHGTLMVTVNLNMLGRTLGVHEPQRHLTNLQNVLQRSIPLSKIKRAINSGFEERFDAKLKRGTLTSRERQTAKKLYKIKYSKRDWNIGNEDVCRIITKFSRLI